MGEPAQNTIVDRLLCSCNTYRVVVHGIYAYRGRRSISSRFVATSTNTNHAYHIFHTFAIRPNFADESKIHERLAVGARKVEESGTVA